MECPDPGLNQGPLDLQSNALPTELSRLADVKNSFKMQNCEFNLCGLGVELELLNFGGASGPLTIINLDFI